MDFTGKKYVLAGVGGIGSTTAELLATLGAKMILLDVVENKLKDVVSILPGEGHVYYVCDFSNVESIEPLLAQVIKEQGAIDGYVHTTGIGAVRPLKMSKYDFMLNVMNINFFSFVEVVRCLSKKGAYNPGMNVVGISAVGAYIGNSTKTAYCASKSAMNSAIRCLAKELAPKGIRLNTVAPGATDTPMAREAADYRNGTEEQRINTLRQYLGICQPIDIANGVAFLLSDMSRMITGTCLPIDGGKLTS
jgi:NAD(P)-dependent dehydrogenase (short-subunit alcohol dehydrogenase family)